MYNREIWIREHSLDKCLSPTTVSTSLACSSDVCAEEVETLRTLSFCSMILSQGSSCARLPEPHGCTHCPASATLLPTLDVRSSDSLRASSRAAVSLAATAASTASCKQVQYGRTMRLAYEACRGDNPLRRQDAPHSKSA